MRRGTANASEYWLKSRVGYQAWELLERIGLSKLITMLPWKAPAPHSLGSPVDEHGSVNDGVELGPGDLGWRWPISASEVAFGLSPLQVMIAENETSYSPRPFTLHVPIGSLIVGSASLACGVRALDDEPTATAVQLIGTSDKSVAMLSRSSEFSEAVDRELQLGNWRQMAKALASGFGIESIGPSQLGSLKLGRSLMAGDGTVISKPDKSHRGTTASLAISESLAAHPLWRAALPLFSDSVRRTLS